MTAGIFVLDLSGPVIFLPLAFVPLCAGIGIARRKVWSAYGFALYLLVQAPIMIGAVFRRGHPAGVVWETIVLAALSAGVAILFFRAGQTLSRAGAPRGRPVAWIALSALSILPLLFVQDFTIPTEAMENTILRGDRIVVRNFPSPDPARGDLIVFAYPIDRRQTFVKRVVGVGGDRIRISGKILYRNGVPVDEPYAIHKADLGNTYRDNFPSTPYEPLFRQAHEMLDKHVAGGDVVVPSGSYFVLGDNRDFSLDSRYWGFIPRGDLIGKPFLVYDSDPRTNQELTKGRVFRARYTRWGRIFKVL